MRISALVVFLLLLGPGSLWAAEATAPPAAADATSPEQRRQEATLYHQLVERVLGGDAAIDYTALRLAYAFTDQYDPYAVHTRAPVADALKAMNAGDCAMALKKSDELLKTDFTIVALHVMRNTCFMRMKDQAKADLSLAIARGLVASLSTNADGRSRETAYAVVSQREESFVLFESDVAVTTQSTIKANGRVYDVVNGRVRKTGQPTTMWFNITPILVGEASRAAAGLPPLR